MLNFANFNQVNGKSISLLFISIDEYKQDWAVVTGTAVWNGHGLCVDFGQNEPLFRVPKYAIDRLRRVNSEIQDVIKNAEFYIPLFVRDLPENVDPTRYIYTGLQWPAN